MRLADVATGVAVDHPLTVITLRKPLTRKKKDGEDIKEQVRHVHLYCSPFGTTSARIIGRGIQVGFF